MRAMVLERTRARLRRVDRPSPGPVDPQEVRIQVRACGVCRTDLHIVDGELPDPSLPLVPGHEIVGTITEVGPGVSRFSVGDRVGVPWLGRTCGTCEYCRSGRENLCDLARFTGYQFDGGYADSTVADARYIFPIPARFSDTEAAPLLCAGIVGFRALRFTGSASRVGFYGFGASAHLATQVARFRGQRVFAFTRPGDSQGQAFARRIGAEWAGGSDEAPPVPLDAAIIFAPVGPLVPAALAATSKGGTVVCAGIHMTDIPGFPYLRIWGERSVRSVANLTRADGEEFLRIAEHAEIRPVTRTFPLEAADEALAALRDGRLEGAAVLVP